LIFEMLNDVNKRMHTKGKQIVALQKKPYWKINNYTNTIYKHISSVFVNV
jgi:hypothetical protein